MPMMPAVLGPNLKLANFRLGYLPVRLAAVRSARVSILIAGAEARTRVRIGSLIIRDVINDTPNTCEFRIGGTAPAVGDAVRILLGTDARLLLFNGEIQMIDLSYEGKAANWVWRCSAIDDTAKLNQFRPFGAYTTTSATTVAQSLISNFAPGFTSTHVQAALPNISVNFDSTEGFSGALKQIAKLIGGYFYVEDADLHLFQTETSNAPDNVDASHRPLDDPPITISTDYSQLRTRVYGQGGGVTALVEIAPGETILPVDDVAWYEASGGIVVSPGTQRITYTGTLAGGVGGLVGPGAAPSVAPSTTLINGTGIDTGTHIYAVSFITASGESLVGPTRTRIVGASAPDLPQPSFIGSLQNDPVNVAASSPISGHTYRLGYTFFRISDSVESLMSAPSNAVVSDGHFLQIATSGIETPPAGFAPNFYISIDGGAYSLFGGGSVTAGFWQFAWTTGTLGASPPSTNKVTVGFPVGPTGTTQRKIYRTVAAGSQLKLLTTIADNTTTTFTDTTADSSLGANNVTVDGSGLAQPSGQSLAGASTLIVAGTGPFASGGGWAIVGNGQQVIRYTGKTDTTLTGIPATGIGSLSASISWNSAITVAPSLIGIPASGAGSIVYTIKEGDPVDIWVQRDNLTAQGLYGIHEGPPLVDGRRASTSLTALCDAELALYANPIQTVPYATRDVKTKSGKTVTINLTSPPISAILVIQDVTISEIEVAPGLLPKFTATASSVRFSLEDVLRRAAAEQAS